METWLQHGSVDGGGIFESWSPVGGGQTIGAALLEVFIVRIICLYTVWRLPLYYSNADFCSRQGVECRPDLGIVIYMTTSYFVNTPSLIF